MALTFSVPKLGLGTAPHSTTDGGPFSVASDAQSIETIRHGLDKGVNFIDTAPRYGSGVAEKRVGAALAGIPRSSYILQTKIGVVVNADGTTTRSYTRDAVRQSIDDSLKRLKVDTLDMALIHDADKHYREALDHAYPVLADLKSQGVIRGIGAGMNQWQLEAAFARSADFDCFLLAGRYTLLEQEPLKSFFPLCQQKKISIFLGGVFNSGILASGAIPRARYQYAEAPADIMEKTRKIEAVCERHSVSLRVAAVQFALAPAAVTSLILGMITPAEVDENLAALNTPIPPQFWDELKAEKLIDGDSPTPTKASTKVAKY